MSALDLTNRSFGKLIALNPARTNTGKYGWRCKCECNNYIIVRTADLIRGHTTSCACLREAKNRTHGLSNSPLYNTWCNILKRCFNKNNSRYKNYGGKGIVICEE